MLRQRRTRIAEHATPLVAAGLLALSLGACDKNGNAYVAPPPPQVGVARPLREDITRYLQLTGTTQAVKSVDLVARVQGYLREIYYKDGAQVAAGAPLFRIEQDQYKAALAQAQAGVDSAKASLVNAQAQFARQQRLGTQKFTPQADVDTARATMQTAQAQLEQAQANVNVAELNLGYTDIKAPFAGVVSARQADVGALVGYGSPTVLATIVQIDPIYAVFTVSEPEVLRIRGRLAAQGVNLAQLGPIRVEAGTQVESGYPHIGTLDYVAPQADSTTGTLTARAVFPNKDGVLPPGVFVRIRIPLTKEKNALLVPARAFGFDQQGSYVFVVGKNNLAAERHVVAQTGEDGMQIIESGLSPDDVVVVDGMARAIPGEPVAPHDVAIVEHNQDAGDSAPNDPPAAQP